MRKSTISKAAKTFAFTAADPIDKRFPWVTKDEAATTCSMSARHFDAVIRPHLPDFAVRGGGSGSAVLFDATAVVAVYTERQVALASAGKAARASVRIRGGRR